MEQQEPIPKSEEVKTEKVEIKVGNKYPKMFLVTTIIIALLFGGIAIVAVLDNMDLHKELTTLNSSINTTEIFNKGIVASVAELVKTTNECQIVLVQYQNVSRQLVDVQCVRDLLKAQNITGG